MTLSDVILLIVFVTNDGGSKRVKVGADISDGVITGQPYLKASDGSRLCLNEPRNRSQHRGTARGEEVDSHMSATR